MLALPRTNRETLMRCRARRSDWYVPRWASGQPRPFVLHFLPRLIFDIHHRLSEYGFLFFPLSKFLPARSNHAAPLTLGSQILTT